MSETEKDDPAQEPPALLHALDEAMLKNVGNPKLQGIAEVWVYHAWDKPEGRAEIERRYLEHLRDKKTI